MGLHLEGLLRPHRHGSKHHSSPAASAPAAAGGENEQMLQAAAAGAAGAASSGVGVAAVSTAGAAADLSAPAPDRDAELLPALGIDLEWQPEAENSSPPSLLQLSTGGWCGTPSCLSLEVHY